MGCGTSTPATTPEPHDASNNQAGNTVPAQGVQKSNTAGSKNKAKQKGAKASSDHLTTPAAATVKSTTQEANQSLQHATENGTGVPSSETGRQVAVNSASDPHWKALWNVLHSHLLDPVDVHATIEDLMARTTNRLSATEITFLQRRVRNIVRATQSVTKKRISIASNNESTEGRVIAERYHLLNKHVVKKILPTCRPKGSVDPMECAYTLLVYCHESLWDRVADIAVQSCKQAGLEMDVNKQTPVTTIPTPCTPLDDVPEVAPGVSFHSLSFLLALALRKW
jgi:hypothetical protein